MYSDCSFTSYNSRYIIAGVNAILMRMMSVYQDNRYIILMCVFGACTLLLLIELKAKVAKESSTTGYKVTDGRIYLHTSFCSKPIKRTLRICSYEPLIELAVKCT